MAEQWGAPLTDAQMKLLRLNEGARYQFFGPFTHTWGEYERGIDDGWDDFGNGDYRLPADHPAYTLLEKGWLDGRNVRLWFGGDKAPDDWDCNHVLFRNGLETWGIKDSSWEHKYGFADIIAYIAKDGVDVTETPVDDNQPDLTLADERQPETVTIAKMTEAEARKKAFEFITFPYSRTLPEDHILETFRQLGLIKPEPTLLERFWSTRDIKDVYGPPSKAFQIIEEALNFERESKD